MATPTLTKQPTVTTAGQSPRLANATDEEKLARFAALRDSSNPHDAEQAMRISEELIERFMPLVGAAVKRWRARMPKAVTIVGFDDLKAAGAGGLWEALLRFDPDRGTPFVKFANRYVSWAMSAEVRRADALGTDARRSVQRSWRALASLENRLGREATEEEAAADFGVSLYRYRQLKQWDQRSLTAELTDPLVNYLSGSTGGSDPLERLCAVEEALEELAEDSGVDADIASSVSEIGQAVESIKGYFEGNLAGAA